MACSGLGSISAAQINNAAISTGLPCEVVRAQLQAESGGKLGLTSSANAQGPWQFLPGTYSGLGCKPGGINDPAAATDCYVKYMQQLLRQFNGSIRNALAAYNAGPGNVSAGLGYADSILAASKTPGSATSSGASTSSGDTGASTTSLIPGISVTDLVKSAIDQVLKMLGITRGLTDMFQRLGLVILGFALVIIGIHLLSGGTGGQSKVVVNEPAKEEGSEEGSSSSSSSASKEEVKTTTKKTATSAGKGVGAEEAVEAAAAA
jgi:hypothetical protein